MSESLRNALISGALGLIGGLIATYARFLLEYLLPRRYQEQQAATQVRQRYTWPILAAAAELRDRLGNIILVGHRQLRSLEEREPTLEDYFFLSSLYVVGQYFAWIEILRQEIVFLDLGSGAANRRFRDLLEAVIDAFRDSFWEEKGRAISQLRDVSIARHRLHALGDLMIEVTENGPRCLNYRRFCQRYLASDPEFVPWFHWAAELFVSLGEDERDFRWDRLIIIHERLSRLIEYLDPGHSRVAPARPVLGRLRNREIAERILARGP
jgi:hypothetical protein